MVRALAAATVLLPFVCAEALAQWPSLDVEVVYRDGHREPVRASPFRGVWELEVDLGYAVKTPIKRADVRFFCFKACPEKLPTTLSDEDIVVWADGTQTAGRVWVSGYMSGDIVLQNGRRTHWKKAGYIQFREPPVRKPAPYDGTAAGTALTAAQEAALKPLDRFKECDVCPEMIAVAAGSFRAGSDPKEVAPSFLSEKRFNVTIGQRFAMGRFAVTFDEWDACVADGGCTHRPSDAGWGRGNRPVITVSADDVESYLEWLSRKTGKTYRLPSLAEREYIARAGTTTPFWWGSTITPKQANYRGDWPYQDGETGENRQHTLPVDSFEPNPWGFYQVHGNVWEWTQDCNDPYSMIKPIADGSADRRGGCDYRALRGGSWNEDPKMLRAAGVTRAAFVAYSTDVGFRVVRVLAP